MYVRDVSRTAECIWQVELAAMDLLIVNLLGEFTPAFYCSSPVSHHAFQGGHNQNSPCHLINRKEELQSGLVISGDNEAHRPRHLGKKHPVLSDIQHTSSELSRWEPQYVQNDQQYASMNFAHRELLFQFPAHGGGRFLCVVLKDLVEELRNAKMALFASDFFSNIYWCWATHSKKTLASILNKAPLYLQIRVVSHSNIVSKRERGRRRL